MGPVLTNILVIGLGVLFLVMFIYSFYLLLSSPGEQHPKRSFKHWQKLISRLIHRQRARHV